MSIFERKPKEKTNSVAQTLFEDFIDNDKQFPKQPTIPNERLADYEKKMFLYRFALVIMALLAEEQHEPTYSKVIPIVESYVLPASPSEQAVAYMTRVRDAMNDLNALITRADRPGIMELLTQQKDPNRGVNQAPEYSFALAWLHDIGVDESNPVALFLFSLWWMEAFIMITKTVQGVKPVE